MPKKHKLQVALEAKQDELDNRLAEITKKDNLRDIEVKEITSQLRLIYDILNK